MRRQGWKDSAGICWPHWWPFDRGIRGLSVRGGYGVQQGWALGPHMMSWPLISQVLVPEILDSFFKHHVLSLGLNFWLIKFPMKLVCFYVLITIYLLIIRHLFCTKVVLPLLEPTSLWDFLPWVLQCESHSKLNAEFAVKQACSDV